MADRLNLWEKLSGELNYKVRPSQRGTINLFHSDGQRDAYARRGNTMINQGDDAILLDRDGVRKLLPCLDFEQTRLPMHGGRGHKRGGTARWPGAMRAARTNAGPTRGRANAPAPFAISW